MTLILEIIWEALKFGMAIFNVAMDDKKKADADNKAFLIDQARRKAWADAAILQLGLDAKIDTGKADASWDKQDQDKPNS